jgi:hypothetical protein
VTLTEFIIVSIMLAITFIFPSEGFDVEEKKVAVRINDRLARMWDQQVDFMKLLQVKRGFPEFPTDLASKKGQQFLKDIRNHLMEELFEAGQHLKNAKSHRATEIPEVDRAAYKEELVDALHLYLELVIASGITVEELVEAYMAKGDVNVKRIKDGY